MSCMWIKDGFHFKFNSAQVSGLPTEQPTISILGSSGLPTEFPTELPTVSIYVSSGQPYLHGSPLQCPLSCPLFHILEAVGCLLSCPLSCQRFPYMEVVGSLICLAKFPWAAHGQPTLLPTFSPLAAKWAAPLFFSVWDIRTLNIIMQSKLCVTSFHEYINVH